MVALSCPLIVGPANLVPQQDPQLVAWKIAAADMAVVGQSSRNRLERSFDTQSFPVVLAVTSCCLLDKIKMQQGSQITLQLEVPEQSFMQHHQDGIFALLGIVGKHLSRPAALKISEARRIGCKKLSPTSLWSIFKRCQKNLKADAILEVWQPSLDLSPIAARNWNLKFLLKSWQPKGWLQASDCCRLERGPFPLATSGGKMCMPRAAVVVTSRAPIRLKGQSRQSIPANHVQIGRGSPISSSWLKAMSLEFLCEARLARPWMHIAVCIIA